MATILLTWQPDHSHGNQTAHMATRPLTWQPDRSHGNQTAHMATRQLTWQPDSSHGNRTAHVATRQLTCGLANFVYGRQLTEPRATETGPGWERKPLVWACHQRFEFSNIVQLRAPTVSPTYQKSMRLATDPLCGQPHTAPCPHDLHTSKPHTSPTPYQMIHIHSPELPGWEKVEGHAMAATLE